MKPGTCNTSPTTFNIQKEKQNMGETFEVLLLAHAITGCGTTSAFYKKGKVRGLKILQKHKELRDEMKTFYNKDATKEAVKVAGETFILKLYGSNSKTLDELRFFMYNRIVAKQKLDTSFQLASLPPTSAAAEQHSYRVYFQVQEWLGNSFDPTEWGWCMTNRSLKPVPTTKEAAPTEPLHLISCNCKQGRANRTVYGLVCCAHRCVDNTKEQLATTRQLKWNLMMLTIKGWGKHHRSFRDVTEAARHSRYRRYNRRRPPRALSLRPASAHSSHLLLPLHDQPHRDVAPCPAPVGRHRLRPRRRRAGRQERDRGERDHGERDHDAGPDHDHDHADDHDGVQFHGHHDHRRPVHDRRPGAFRGFRRHVDTRHRPPRRGVIGRQLLGESWKSAVADCDIYVPIIQGSSVKTPGQIRYSGINRPT